MKGGTPLKRNRYGMSRYQLKRAHEAIYKFRVSLRDDRVRRYAIRLLARLG